MATLIFDIETQPTTDPEIIERVTADVGPPKNYSKPETIATWWMTEGEKEKQAAIDSTSLDGTFGSIFCIGFKMVSAEGSVLNQGVISGGGVPSDREVGVLNTFNRQFDYHMMHSGGRPVTEIVGYNIVGFDFPFLMRRMAIKNIAMHPILARIVNSKPWDGAIYDVALRWKGGASKMNKAADVAKAMGIPMKTGGISGKDVAQALRDGRQQEVKDYCMEDVEATYAMYLRMKACGF